jgi:hypothetical protein
MAKFATPHNPGLWVQDAPGWQCPPRGIIGKRSTVDGDAHGFRLGPMQM